MYGTNGDTMSYVPFRQNGSLKILTVRPVAHGTPPVTSEFPTTVPGLFPLLLFRHPLKFSMLTLLWKV